MTSVILDSAVCRNSAGAGLLAISPRPPDLGDEAAGRSVWVIADDLLVGDMQGRKETR